LRAKSSNSNSSGQNDMTFLRGIGTSRWRLFVDDRGGRSDLLHRVF
jgi:hypothetical protein